MIQEIKKGRLRGDLSNFEISLNMKTAMWNIETFTFPPIDITQKVHSIRTWSSRAIWTSHSENINIPVFRWSPLHSVARNSALLWKQNILCLCSSRKANAKRKMNMFVSLGHMIEVEHLAATCSQSHIIQ